MTVSQDHPAVRRYLSDLERAAAPLPAEQRSELVAEIGAHLADALGEGPLDDVTVNRALARMGDPVAIVRAELPAEAPAARWGALEVVTVLLLAPGAFVLPVIGPVTALFLMRASRRWGRTTRRWTAGLVLTPLAFGAYALLSMATATFEIMPSGLFEADFMVIGLVGTPLTSLVAAVMLGCSPRR